MPDLVKGHGFIGKGIKATQDEGEILDRSASLAASLVKSVKASHHTPGLVKGMNPIFAKEFGVFNMGLQEFSQRAEDGQILAQLAQTVLGKTITTASPLSSSFVPYDLLAPTKLLYPYYTPLRNKVGRPQGQGKSRLLKLITGVSGSQTPSGSNGFSKIATAEVTDFSTTTAQAGPRTNLGSQTASDLSIPYTPMIQTEALSWLAQFEGQGFDDIAALLNLILLQEFTMNEEGQMLYSTNTALVAPTTAPVCTLRAAGSNETALTGYTTNAYVCYTAANPYGETVMSSRATVVMSAGKVIDVAVIPPAGAAWVNIYVGTGGSDPGRAGEYVMATGVGGTKFTLQGVIPTSTVAVPPAADSGTRTTGGYEGILSVLSGTAVTNTVYPTGFTGGVSTSVGDVLNQNAVNSALKTLWDGSTAGFRADPSEIVAEGRDLANLSNDILTNAHSTAYSLRISQDEVNNIKAGGAVSSFVNPLSRSIVNLLVHPSLAQGTALLMSYTAPHANANIGNLWENVMVQDLMSIKWPVNEMAFRFSIFALGALVAQGPQFSGILQGLQLSNTTPYS